MFANEPNPDPSKSAGTVSSTIFGAAASRNPIVTPNMNLNARTNSNIGIQDSTLNKIIALFDIIMVFFLP